MKSCLLVRSGIGIAVGLIPAAALAQAGWTPGVEVIGQPIQVTTNGVTNTVYLDPGGQLRVMTPGGQTIPGSWTAANGQLCLSVAGRQECVPYSGPFQAGAPTTLTSSCGASETWLAQATNAPPPPPARGQKGERGR
ncbi:MAG TPA: hypothetical protein VHS33_13035 [Sphingomicrobium sp.]|jgi:hypothetical protein|nr:hypothetical protein [Sphingomicrobium sp.]